MRGHRRSPSVKNSPVDARLPPEEWEREESPLPPPQRTPGWRSTGRSIGERTPSPGKMAVAGRSQASSRNTTLGGERGVGTASSSPSHRRTPIQVQDTYSAHRRPVPSPGYEEPLGMVRTPRDPTPPSRLVYASHSQGSPGVAAAAPSSSSPPPPPGGWARAAGMAGMYSDEHVRAVARSMELLRMEGLDGSVQDAESPLARGDAFGASPSSSLASPEKGSPLQASPRKRRGSTKTRVAAAADQREMEDVPDDVVPDGQSSMTGHFEALFAGGGNAISPIAQREPSPEPSMSPHSNPPQFAGQDATHSLPSRGLAGMAGTAGMLFRRHQPNESQPEQPQGRMPHFEGQHPEAPTSHTPPPQTSVAERGETPVVAVEPSWERCTARTGLEAVSKPVGRPAPLGAVDWAEPRPGEREPRLMSGHGDLGGWGKGKGESEAGGKTVAHVRLSVKSAEREARKNTFNYCLAFSAVFIAVSLVATAHTVYRFTPIFFLSIAEYTVGEQDIVITAGSWTGLDHLNYTSILSTIGKERDFSHSSPRMVKDISLFDASICRGGLDVTNVTQLYRGPPGGKPCTDPMSAEACLKENCHFPKPASAYFVDMKREAAMGFGKRFELSPGPGGVLIQQELASRDGLELGSTIVASVTMDRYLAAIMSTEAEESMNGQGLNRFSSTWTVLMPFTVTGVFSEPMGKFDNDETNAAIFDYDDFFRRLPGQIRPEMPLVIRDAQAARHYDYVSSLTFNLPPPRLERYMKNDYSKIQQEVLLFVSRLVSRLGYEDVQPRIKLLSELRKLQIFSLFLGLIISVVMSSLIGLLVLLIYSLLIVSVETRAFDLGVMRMVGMTRAGIVQLLLIQTFTFSVPAWGLGLIVAHFLSQEILKQIGVITGSDIEAWLFPDTIAWATVMGLLVPCFAAVLPIRKALTSNLRDALDVSRSKVTAVQVTVERSTDGRPPAFIVTGGLTLTTFGFMIYYLFPRALLELDLPLLLYIFFGLLIGMLLGLAILSLNLEQSMEHLVGYALLWWNGPSIRAMMFKNLTAHRLRNRKTTIMYSLSLAFIIFIVVTFALQIVTFQYQYKQQNGQVLRLRCPSWADSSSLLYRMRQLKESNPNVLDIGWISHSLRSVIGVDTRIHTLGKTVSASQYVYAVSPNFLDTTLPGFLTVDASDDESGYSLSEQLYTPRGSQSALMGSLYQKSMSLSLSSNFLLTSRARMLDRDTDPNAPPPVDPTTRMRPLAFLRGAAGAKFSIYPEAEDQDLLISLPTYFNLAAGQVLNPYGSQGSRISSMPIRLIMVKMDEATATDAILDETITHLTRAGSQHGCYLDDVRRRYSALSVALEAMDYFSWATMAVAMVVSFFSLTSSMYANISEQTKEIGMLRALGLKRRWIQRVYTLEAFTLVTAATLMGLAMGTAVAFTVTSQRALFTQLPVPFAFPWSIFGWVVAASFLSAVGASFLPATRKVRQNIASLMRSV